jgi:hypothetical protein
VSETVYIETSVIGYLTARSTKNLIIAGNIETTRDWWQNRRNDFVLYISPKMSKGCPRFKNKCVVQTHNILSGGTGLL